MYCSTLIFPSPFITPTKTPFKTHFFALPRKTQIRKHYRLKNPINFSLDNPPKTPFPSFKRQENENENNARPNIHENALSRIAKPLAACTLFWLAIGLCPIRPLQLPSLAITAATTDVSNYDKDYSNYIQKMLEYVAKLRRTVRKVLSGKGDVKEVETALGEVKSKGKELQEAFDNEMVVELDALQEELEALNYRAEMVNELTESARSEHQTLLVEVEGNEKVKPLLAKAEEVLGKTGDEYDGICKRIREIEEVISKKEMVYNAYPAQLHFLERQSTLLVDNFFRQMRQKNINGSSQGSLTKLSRSEIHKELQSAQSQFWKQKILPKLLKNEDNGNSIDEDSRDFTQRLKQALEGSREMQKDLKRSGAEKRVIVNSSVDEILKGSPEVEFISRSKEPQLPYCQTSPEERILSCRDKVVSSTWFNEERNRWEIDPIAVPYALSQKLVENARIRHDWGAMYLGLKGDDNEYYVNLKELDVLFDDFGGLDGLCLKMLASGIPTSVQLMWIPFLELNIRQQLVVLRTICEQLSIGLWNSIIVSFVRVRLFQLIRTFAEDILAIFIFPVVDFATSCLETRPWGVALINLADQYLNWNVFYSNLQYATKLSMKSRNFSGLLLLLWLYIRIKILGYAMPYISGFLTSISTLFREVPITPNDRKLKAVKAYFKFRKLRLKGRKKGRKDPISSAFDRMKRVKDPPIRLKDFASVESMREELNEVVAFLQNPRAFQEMGARAPRGVLIVGETGTGKTSLALAIAAEASVPVVRVKAEQLEAGLMVGQGASNIRELFQTARDLAPVIIFVEDFDLFAGARGDSIDTQKQDHEAFINQLLVELDGFEKQEGVVLMATTRNVKKIDEALMRPGRMDRIFHLQQPTQAERVNILRTAARENMDSELIDVVDWEKVAEKTAFLRPFELKLVPMALESSAFKSKFLDAEELMSYCSWFATFGSIVPKWLRKTTLVKTVNKMLVNHLGLRLTKLDLQKVVDVMEPYGIINSGIELVNPPGDWTRETKFPHAVWTAGRGLVAALLPNFDVVHNLWLEPNSWQGVGCTKITKGQQGDSTSLIVESRSYLEKRLVFCFGSYIAAQMMLPFGEENLLSASELKEAQEIATRMVLQYGWGPSHCPTIYHHRNSGSTLSMGDKHLYEMASNVEKVYYLAYDKAKALLQRNRLVLEKIVEELVEFEVLTGKDLERIISENDGAREIEPFYLSKGRDEEPVFRRLLEMGMHQEVSF